MLKKNRNLTEIDLMNSTGFDDETFLVSLLEIMENRNAIKYVSLNIPNIKPTDAKEKKLIKVLINNKFISRLCLSTSIISHSLVEALIYAARELNVLTHLEFYNCQVDNEDMAQLQLLDKDKVLMQLVFSEAAKWKMIDTNDQLIKGKI